MADYFNPQTFITDIHCSSLPQWAVCEAQQVWKLTHAEDRPARGEHVATWMGTCIHSILAGAGEVAPPDALVFDGITPTLSVAWQQIDAMAAAINAKLLEEGWEVTAHEYAPDPIVYDDLDGAPVRLIGTIDLGLYASLRRRATVDLKTSAEYRAAWLQLGGYALLDPVDVVGTIHCPRPPTLIDEPVAEFHYNKLPAAAVADQAFRVLRRAAAILHDDKLAIAAPGTRCASCPNDGCIVRSVGRVPNL